MEYTQITLNDWLEMKQKLKQELLGVKQSFVRIGYALRKIDDAKLYEQDGYKSVAEFAKSEYGLEGSTVSRFMSINREYSIDGYSERLKPEYADFNRSQLEEMLKLPEADREMVTPDTARKEIRDIKKFNQAEPQEGIADDITELIRHFGEDNAETLEKLYQCGIADNMYDNINRLIEIVHPGGSRSYRKGLFFLMFHEDCLKYKKYGQTPQRMEYREFFERILDAFGDEPEEETMEEVTEAEHERTDSEPEREVEELAAEPQRDKKIGFDAFERKNILLVRPSHIMQAAPIINSLFINHNIVFGDTPIMRWYTNNTKKQMDSNGNITYGKIEPNYRKTDGFMAFVNTIVILDEIPEEIDYKEIDFGVYTY